MLAKLAMGGCLGAIIGAILGWFATNSVMGAAGIGCALAAGICGALMSSASEDDAP